jgi:hypothetical protein
VTGSDEVMTMKNEELYKLLQKARDARNFEATFAVQVALRHSARGEDKEMAWWWWEQALLAMNTVPVPRSVEWYDELDARSQ